MTSDEVAAHLGKSPHWVQLNAKGLGIPRVRLGNHYRYRISDVDAWMEKR